MSDNTVWINCIVCREAFEVPAELIGDENPDEIEWTCGDCENSWYEGQQQEDDEMWERLQKEYYPWPSLYNMEHDNGL